MALPTIVAQRSGLFYSQQRGGLPVIQDTHVFTGNVFFVMTGGSDTAGVGQHPDSPFATIDFAIGQCTANQGDTIIVMPGHTETVSGAQGIDLDVAGISIIGLGRGDSRPVIDFTASTSTLEINADDCYLENLIFLANFTNGVVEAIDIKTGADDTYFKNCEWREDVNTQEFLKGVTIEATINRVTFDGCRFKTVIGGDSLSAIFTEGAITDLVVKHCTFNGDWLEAVIDTNAAAITVPEFYDLLMRNADPTNGFGILLNSSTIASIVKCHILTQKSNTVPISDISASFISEVYGTDVANASAIVMPATPVAWS